MHRRNVAPSGRFAGLAPMQARLLLGLIATVALGGCGSSATRSGTAAAGVGEQSQPTTGLRAHPQAVEPTVGQSAAAVSSDPVGDPSAHPVSLAEVRRELKIVQEL